MSPDAVPVVDTPEDTALADVVRQCGQADRAFWFNFGYL
eukprot:CAMPEP_0174242810 /NCGR_PEP_ID=MMETSP0417-20130205/29243_1 /TAXON_ID=242541 /ORGANISM="Mayorella sp, Strain BSH-02190019" /LENGTH=38 /DNA_ID= /DNA_START= /DNA_END= /DNA_ORIENTATION=